MNGGAFAQPRPRGQGVGGERDGGGMRALARCGLMTALGTVALICDLVIVLSFLPGADAQVELCGILGDEAIRRRGLPAVR